MSGYYSPWRLWLRRARGLLYPRRCPYCGRVLGTLAACEECGEELKKLLRSPTLRLTPGQHYLGSLSGAAAPYRYKGCVRRGILRSKYEGAPWNAVEMGADIARLLFAAEIKMCGSQPVPQPSSFGAGYDCIVPVPPSGRTRGYNVPELMALPLAEALGLPLEKRALARVKAGRHQAGLPADERLVNVAGAFKAAAPEAIEGRRVLLVDDVITTGATAAACAQALLAAGAESVFAAALATVEFPSLPARGAPIFENRED